MRDGRAVFGFVSGSRIKIPDLRSGGCASQEAEVPVVGVTPLTPSCEQFVGSPSA